MLGQVKNNKGFNLLELIVVIAIVGFISAISYPNFSSWNKERKTRAAVKEVEAMIRKRYSSNRKRYFCLCPSTFFKYGEPFKNRITRHDFGKFNNSNE